MHPAKLPVCIHIYGVDVVKTITHIPLNQDGFLMNIEHYFK